MPLSPPPATLAPTPDFRYVEVGLEPDRPAGMAGALGIAAGSAIGGVLGTVYAGAHVGSVVATGVAATGVLAHLAGWTRGPGRARGVRSMVVVPWGAIIETSERTRILRWAAVTRVQVETIHGRDQGTPTTRYSVLTIETARERFIGRARGALPLERLSAHLTAYASEAAHRIALDLDGVDQGEGPVEPDVELVLSSVAAYIASARAAARLELRGPGYRLAGVRAGNRAVRELAAVLSDRTARAIDPRPFAAVLSAELGVAEVAAELIELVQSPLPVLAAIAKVAATKLAVSRARVGTLEEVEPFLLRRDAEALAAWQVA